MKTRKFSRKNLRAAGYTAEKNLRTTGYTVERRKIMPKTYNYPVDLEKRANKEQLFMFHRIVQGYGEHKSFLIIGDAGTGKSYLINLYTEFCRKNYLRVIMVAPTGAAATNINGATIHSVFSIAPNIAPSQPTYDQASKINSDRCVISRADVIIFDEVSMMRIDMFENVMNQIKLANAKRAKYNQPPIQIILTGDFGQIGPVITPDDRNLYKQITNRDLGKGWCFKSPIWDEMNFETIELHTQMRQTNKEFYDALGGIKIGVEQNDGLNYINMHKAKQPISNAIWLCGFNKTVDAKNNTELAKLPGKIYTSRAEVHGDAKITQTNMVENLSFKIGARVMMTMNHKNQFHNGSLGEIKDILSNGQIVIRLDDGFTCYVEKEKISVYRYRADSSDGIKQVEVGSVYQYPFKLGYAVTIHKSQGATYDAANISAEIFGAGQLYTALSRCRDIDKMYVDRPLTKSMLMPDSDVIKFLINQSGYAYKQNQQFADATGMTLPY